MGLISSNVMILLLLTRPVNFEKLYLNVFRYLPETIYIITRFRYSNGISVSPPSFYLSTRRKQPIVITIQPTITCRDIRWMKLCNVIAGLYYISLLKTLKIDHALESVLV